MSNGNIIPSLLLFIAKTPTNPTDVKRDPVNAIGFRITAA